MFIFLCSLCVCFTNCGPAVVLQLGNKLPCVRPVRRSSALAPLGGARAPVLMPLARSTRSACQRQHLQLEARHRKSMRRPDKEAIAIDIGLLDLTDSNRLRCFFFSHTMYLQVGRLFLWFIKMCYIACNHLNWLLQKHRH